ncbi:hypothetical protein TNCV_3072711, partial [Trichonephila clavipes]
MKNAPAFLDPILPGRRKRYKADSSGILPAFFVH